MLRIILLTFAISSANAHLVDPDNYAELVTKKMMENFGKNSYPLELLKLQDFTQQIESTRFGKTAKGPMRFHSGFVMSVGSASITKNVTILNNENVLVQIFFQLQDLRTVYDIHYDLEHYKADGAVVIKFVAASYEINFIRPHGSTAIESTINYIGNTGNQKFMEILVDPDNEYTQIVARELKSKKDFRNPMDNSFKEWGTALKPALDEAIEQTPFPKINYYKD